MIRRVNNLIKTKAAMLPLIAASSRVIAREQSIQPRSKCRVL